MDRLAVGIDLGTTNSLVAYVVDGVIQMIDLGDGHLLPSTVRYIDGVPKVGDRHPDAYRSMKRLMGASDEAIRVAADILADIKTKVEKVLSRPVSEVVITVPAYFHDAARQATRLAARMAGWQVLRLIHEPTAAALAFGIDEKKQSGCVAVYDLGGGTFDISILRLHEGIFEVLATAGDTHLGGDDIDTALAELLTAKLGIAVPVSVAEKVKRSIRDEVCYEGRSCSVTEAEFWACMEPLLERTKNIARQALRDAGQKVTDLIVVGGPTRLRAVVEAAEEIFQCKADTSVHPDEVVARGAALSADGIVHGRVDRVLLDVTPLGLGIETYGGAVAPLLPRNTRIPAFAEEIFTTYADWQTAVDVHVVQGDRPIVAGCQSLARFRLPLEPMRAGFQRIAITFMMDADGILQVSAKDCKTGVMQAVEVIARAGGQLEYHEEDDQRQLLLIRAKGRAEPLLRASKRHSTDAHALLSGDEARMIDEAIVGLEMLLHQPGVEAEAIECASARLDQRTRHLASLLGTLCVK